MQTATVFVRNALHCAGGGCNVETSCAANGHPSEVDACFFAREHLSPHHIPGTESPHGFRALGTGAWKAEPVHPAHLSVTAPYGLDLQCRLCEFLKNDKNFRETYRIEMQNLKITKKYSGVAASSIDFVINSLHQSFREIGRIGNPNRVESAKERPRRRTTKTYPSS